MSQPRDQINAASDSRQGRVVVLVYHRVLAGTPERGTSVPFALTVEEFAQQMRWLREHDCAVRPLSAALGSGSASRAGVAITFDDGWSSTLRLALPVLLEHGLSATVFITTDPQAEVFDEARGSDPPMTEDQWRELARAGIEIGAHGVTHRPLVELKAEELHWELAESKRRLEAVTGQPVALFATPYGLSSEAVRREAIHCGYRGLCPGRPGINRLPLDPYAIRRMGVPSGTGLDAFGRLASGRFGPGSRVWKEVKWRLRQGLGQRRAARVQSAARGLLGQGKSGSGTEI